MIKNSGKIGLIFDKKMQLTVCFVSFICLSYSAVKRFFFFSLTLLRTQFSTRHWSTTLQYEYTKVAIINIIRITWKLQEFNEKKDHDQSTFFPFIVWILSFWLVVSTWLFSALYTYYSKKQDRIHSTTRIHFIKTIYEPSYNPLSFREQKKWKRKIMCLGDYKKNMKMTDWLTECWERDCSAAARIDKIKHVSTRLNMMENKKI